MHFRSSHFFSLFLYLSKCHSLFSLTYSHPLILTISSSFPPLSKCHSLFIIKSFYFKKRVKIRYSTLSVTLYISLSLFIIIFSNKLLTWLDEFLISFGETFVEELLWFILFLAVWASASPSEFSATHLYILWFFLDIFTCIYE